MQSVRKATGRLRMLTVPDADVLAGAHARSDREAEAGHDAAEGFCHRDRKANDRGQRSGKDLQGDGHSHQKRTGAGSGTRHFLAGNVSQFHQCGHGSKQNSADA
uniref:(northern house mosquito) hypothetical protein n=1 Tax=Culex pipiens TaxID=7175 RepID=A0A8D8CPR5_CULPI